MASPNEFDTYSALGVADYTTPLKQNYKEQEAGWAEWEKAFEQNNQAREKNAEIFGRVITNAQKLAPKLAKGLQAQAEANDKKFKEKGAYYALNAGISLEDQAAYLQSRELANTEENRIGYYRWQAEQNGADSDTIEFLNNLSGIDTIRMNEVVLAEWGGNYKGNFEENIGKVKIPNDDGTFLTWENKTTKSETISLVNKYNEDHGWAGIEGFRREAVDHVALKAQRKSQAEIIEGAEAILLGKFESDKLDKLKPSVTSFAKIGQLGFKIHDILQAETSKWNDKGGANGGARLRAGLKEVIFEAVKDGEISAAQADISGFQFEHRGQKNKDGTPKLTGLEFFKEFENYDEELTNIVYAKRQAEQKEVGNFGEDFTNRIIKTSNEENIPITEEILAEGIVKYKEEFREVFQRDPRLDELPKSLTDLSTVEDKSDETIEGILNQLWANNAPIKLQDWNGLHDKDKRTAWKEKAAKSGFADNIIGWRNAEVAQAVGEFINEKTGKTDWKSTKYTTLLRNATAEYNSLYSELKGGLEPGGERKLHDQIMAVLRTSRLKSLDAKPVKYDSDSLTKFPNAINAGNKFLLEGHNAGKKPFQTVSTGLIPGSEDYLKTLTTEFATDPVNFRVPHYYHEMAIGIDGMDGWDLANVQYRLWQKEQGASDNQIKDLPMTPSKKALESKSPFFKYWNKNKPNPKRTKRSITYEEKGDFNEQYGLNPLMVGATT